MGMSRQTHFRDFGAAGARATQSPAFLYRVNLEAMMESSGDFNSTPELQENGEDTLTAREGTTKERPSSLSAPVSRRALLQGAAGTAGATMILGATPNSAAAVVKLSQKVVAYQDHPDGDKRCGKCVQFQPPNACKIVDGTVSPEGYCRFFVPVARA
jgi:hypothetical protein